MALYVRSSGPDSAPTILFLHGGGVGGWSWEPGVTRQSARDIVATLHNARGRIAAGLSHNWSLENPGLFADTLLSWIENRPLPAELLSLE
ncbi:MAG: hypothetical protein M1582_00855 [Actinobacteria bacterium]|nr:hypothetical protein [Actinomycetota bacterium]